MSNEAWIYQQGTGIFTGTKLYGSDTFVNANLPAGCAARRGPVDPLSQRVDIAATPPPPVFDEYGNDISPPWQPPVIDWQPPAPAADPWQTWSWDAATKRWVSVPTLAAIKRDARQRMAAAWNVAREAGVSIGGKVAPTDAAAWTRYLAIKQMAADGGWVDVPIPLLDGTFHLLTQTQAGTLWAALKDMERTLLARLRDRVEAINNAATAEAVAAITW